MALTNSKADAAAMRVAACDLVVISAAAPIRSPTHVPRVVQGTSRKSRSNTEYSSVDLDGFAAFDWVSLKSLALSSIFSSNQDGSGLAKKHGKGSLLPRKKRVSQLRKVNPSSEERPCSRLHWTRVVPSFNSFFSSVC